MNLFAEPHPYPGLFIAIEGLDGAGKTTQIQNLYSTLTMMGVGNVYIMREPGGTDLGQSLRPLLKGTTMTPLAELLLFTASRMELVTTKIIPILQRGGIVICDRFMDSTYAYQGHGRGLLETTLQMEELVRKHVAPNHVLYLDCPVDVSDERCRARSETPDVFDQAGHDFKTKVYQGFQQRLENWKSHPRGQIYTVIDASKDEETVTSQIVDWATMLIMDMTVSNNIVFDALDASTEKAATEIKIDGISDLDGFAGSFDVNKFFKGQ